MPRTAGSSRSCWHVGRLSHTSLLGGRQPVSSSPLQAKGVNVFIAGEDGSTPGFVQASERAR